MFAGRMQLVFVCDRWGLDGTLPPTMSPASLPNDTQVTPQPTPRSLSEVTKTSTRSEGGTREKQGRSNANPGEEPATTYTS